MKLYTPLVCALSLLLFFSCNGTQTLPDDTGPRSGTFEVLFTGSLNGHLDGCYCTSSPKGGMVKMAHFVKTYRAEHSNTLLLSTGDLFSAYVPRSAILGTYDVTDEEYREFQKEAYIMKGCAYLRYDAMVMGDQDLSRGPAFFYYHATNLPYVNVNTTFSISNDDRAYGVPYVVTNIGGVLVGIMGVVHENVFRFYTAGRKASVKESVRIDEALAKVKEVASNVRKSVDTLILLSHSGYENDKTYLREVPEIDIVIGGHDNYLPLAMTEEMTYETPPRVKDELVYFDEGVVAATGQNGLYVGILRVTVVDGNVSCENALRYERINYGVKVEKEVYEEGMCKAVCSNETYVYCEGDPYDETILSWLKELGWKHECER